MPEVRTGALIKMALMLCGSDPVMLSVWERHASLTVMGGGLGRGIDLLLACRADECAAARDPLMV